MKVIFGTGEYGKTLYRHFIKEEEKIDFFCRTEVEDGQYFMGKPIITICQLSTMEEVDVYIAIKDESESEKVNKHLQAVLDGKSNIYEYGSYIYNLIEHEKNGKKNFNIIGCCISRDLFEYAKSDEGSIIYPGKFMQCSLPVMWFEPPMVPRLNREDIFKLGNRYDWMQETIVRDFNHSFLEYFCEKSDFFIIDCSEFVRYSLAKKEMPCGKYVYYTYSGWLRVFKRDELLDWVTKDIELIENNKVWEMYSIEGIVESILSWLHDSGYSDATIVLIENYYAKDFIEDNRLRKFTNHNSSEKNKVIERFNNEIKKKCSNKLNVIPFIDEVYGDCNHKSGLSPLHMCEDYYLYLKEALEAIANNEWDTQKDKIVLKWTKVIASKRNTYGSYAE